MKKIISLFLILLLTQMPGFASYVDRQLKDAKKNTQYNTVKTHKKNYTKIHKNGKSSENIKIKDPGLIKLEDVKNISKASYDKKIANDEEIYISKIKPAIYKKSNSVNINPEAVDFYNIYRIAERIIRANNLGYVNWRIAIRKSEDYNAASFEGNYIRINTALYDTLYDNEDALAFVIAHEMSHHILGHSQRKIEQNKRRNSWAIPMAFIPVCGELVIAGMDKKAVSDNRLMEYMADAEALQLIIKAGYSPDSAMETLNFIQGMPNVKDFWADHPIPEERIESLKENIVYINPDWPIVGKYNIYNSEVLNCKKSSDRVSVVISSAKNMKSFYEPESMEKRLTRMAYVSYKNGLMDNASKYFYKLAQYKQDYVSYLYLSYANKYLYDTTNEAKYLKRAKNAIEKADKINSNDKYVKEQYRELMNMDNL